MAKRLCSSVANRSIALRTIYILISSLLLAAALAVLTGTEPDPALADGTCASHYPYKVTDGHGHDGDGDGVGCESNPQWPPNGAAGSSAGSTQSTGYDRDNWSYDSSAARARLGCTRDEHVDHIVALKEAYDSSGSSWSSQRKREFANDPLNQWCLVASVNVSKSDRDLAEWSGGSCEQRKFIAQRTQQMKAKYGLSIDPAEQVANAAALAANCTLPTSASSTNITAGLASTRPGLTTWTGSNITTSGQLFDALSARGVRTLWRWNGGNWVGYAEAGSDPIPGAFSFVIGPNDRLYIGN